MMGNIKLDDPSIYAETVNLSDRVGVSQGDGLPKTASLDQIISLAGKEPLLTTATSDAVPLDTDEVISLRSGTKRSTWTVIKAFLKTYFDSLYVIAPGKSGGQTLNGGTAAGENLTLSSTINATKGKINIGTSAYDEVNNWMGLGTTSPANQLTQKSTADLESAPLGSELTDGANWTSAGWTGSYNSFTHTAGNTTALSRTMTNSIGQVYQISFTISGRTAGSITVTLGGQLSTASYSTNAIQTVGPKIISTNGSLIFTPTTDFNGTVSAISVKLITGVCVALYAIKDSVGGNTLEIRSSLATLNNVFIGKEAGRSNTTGYGNSAQGTNCLYANTTGYYNSAHGTFSLYSNTTGNNNAAHGSLSLYLNITGYNNSAQGYGSLNANTTGYGNSAQGYASLYTNTTGYYNSAQGANAGQYISDGVTANATGNNSVFLGYDTRALANGQTNQIVLGASAIGAGSNTVTLGNASIIKTVISGVLQKRALDSAPASATAAGTLGELRITATHIYVCTATNTWVRAALATW